MNGLYDFGSDCAVTYTEQCVKCGKVFEVSTQGNEEHCEYTTDIYIKCDCGESVPFCLPVN